MRVCVCECVCVCVCVNFGMQSYGIRKERVRKIRFDVFRYIDNDFRISLIPQKHKYPLCNGENWAYIF